MIYLQLDSKSGPLQAPEHPCLTNKYHLVRKDPPKSGLTAERWLCWGPSYTLHHACLAARIHSDTLGLYVSGGTVPMSALAQWAQYRFL